MSGSVFALVLVLGPLFGLLGAAAAYAIAYEEYSHHMLGKRRTIFISLRTAMVAFVALMALALAAAWLLSPR